MNWCCSKVDASAYVMCLRISKHFITVGVRHESEVIKAVGSAHRHSSPVSPFPMLPHASPIRYGDLPREINVLDLSVGPDLRQNLIGPLVAHVPSFHSFCIILLMTKNNFPICATNKGLSYLITVILMAKAP